MSRIGKLPITVPNGVTISVSDSNLVSIKGPKGELTVQLASMLTLAAEDGKVSLSRPDNDRIARSQHGLARTLIANSIEGVTNGHTKMLDIVGVGYRATLDGKNLVLNMGYSHPVRIDADKGVAFEIISDDKARTQAIKVSGIDKAVVGQFAADIRKVRKPDPYKGKGIRYRGEVVRLKAGKRAAGKK